MYVPTPPDHVAALATSDADGVKLILAAIGHQPRGYPHWDKVRHLDPPDGLTREQWWAGIKVARAADMRWLSLHDAAGRPFSYALPDAALRLLHLVDQRCSGEVAMEEVVTADAHARERYLVNSLMEEAIRSSQLEGATTSRQVAKELLRSGREPRDIGERMIVNNYRALIFMREEMGERLAPDAVLDLQRILTAGTLEDPDTAGRLQQPGEERVVVVDRDGGGILHEPPPAVELPERLDALCAFANEDDGGERFVHPVVRAILLHFWLAYDHPFADGNGRTARALFYWHLRTRGYRLVEYLSISRILRGAPSAYARSFLRTETDGGDVTYFLLHQLEVVQRAIDELHGYLQRKIRDVRRVERLLDGATGLNRRQLGLLGDALRHPARVYTIREHAATHRVTEETARTDLRQLDRLGLLTAGRGRPLPFVAPADLERRLRGRYAQASAGAY